ncbi:MULTISPECIES: HAD family hydrolase [Vibrio]|uniref:Phosphatase n=1 Tax=Vibrio rotiferianus TaxID=190895 RepID=A0A510IE41_9VIBR|nr:MULTISPECIES: HAD-IA family hydrolase [Vibrio]MDK9777280.1 HAD-IA family hydrolase [Vibrio sp. D401a]MDK9801315.1 HAD-IA family hydrolase [Vibrio sp. D406a]TMX64513.1 phosphatase [Vibrio rotiferianus]CAH1559222.1 Phosphatase [Vibrio rotiferianus]BBL92064.1 phosphatase [Vibrio rotiferianus]
MVPFPLQIENIKAVIFDLDNTLVSSDMNFSQLRHQLGCPSDEDLLDFVEALDHPHHKEHAHNVIFDYEISDAEHSSPMPGCHELLDHLHGQQIKTAIVTRNCLIATQKKLEHNQINVEIVITRECYPPKPDPLSLQVLAKDWRLLPNEVLYVGDHLYDLQAAFNAEMPSCLIHHGNPEDFIPSASVALEQLGDLLSLFHLAHHK